MDDLIKKISGLVDKLPKEQSNQILWILEDLANRNKLITDNFIFPASKLDDFFLRFFHKTFYLCSKETELGEVMKRLCNIYDMSFDKYYETDEVKYLAIRGRIDKYESYLILKYFNKSYDCFESAMDYIESYILELPQINYLKQNYMKCIFINSVKNNYPNSVKRISKEVKNNIKIELETIITTHLNNIYYEANKQ